MLEWFCFPYATAIVLPLQLHATLVTSKDEANFSSGAEVLVVFEC
jgi:hypothetical protein